MPGPQRLLLTLKSVRAGLDGVAGLVHDRVPGAGRLRLVVAEGLTSETVEAWRDLAEDGDTAPARAVREGRFVWVGAESTPGQASGSASMPLMGVDGPIGALTLLTAIPPSAEQRSFLAGTATWLTGFLEGADAEGSNAAPETAHDTLRTLREPFLTVDDGWRITYLNEEAERLLGLGREWLGSVLWDSPAGGVPGLEDRCRRAFTEGTPAAFTGHWSADRPLLLVRCVPSRAGGSALSFTDVIDLEERGPETGADERPVAMWTARMDRLTAALSEAVTSKDIVRTVADHLLPAFHADGMGIEVLEGGRLQVVGEVGYPEDYLRRVSSVQAQDLGEIAQALRTGTPRFIESGAGFTDLSPEYQAFLDMSPMKAWAFLPLATSGRVIGICIITYRRPHVFDDDERALMAASSGVVAQALERARLYDVEHARAQGLQRALLPKSLPDLPAVQAAARYLPVGVDEEVGGDWYDVIPLSADRVAMVVGDVMGHGIEEAATMGRLRTAVRTLAELEMPAAELFGRLNELVVDLGEDFFVTCLYAVFDPVAQTCTICSAGHPAPVVVRPDGTVDQPPLDPDPPLGVAVPPFTTYELGLPGEHVLVFFTDGLVEAAARDMEQGQTVLQRTLGEEMARHGLGLPGHGSEAAGFLDGLCDSVVSALVPDGERTTDDAALLVALTRCTAPDEVVSFDLPEAPQAAGQARRHVRDQLAGWGLEELTMSTELLVSELVGNVVRHAKGPIRLRLLRSRSLICEVYDGSLSTPRIQRAEYTDEDGRGLYLVSELCRRWGARYLAEGKCIWAEQDIPPA
ncbi:SpoIIE family protein phosphatase [Streptomyces sp. NPDC051576]|uniref:ATP-binding SpoIIE family protein phosphatase n=1 Tax=Streptomyces sp. NPDC051576 TaxID=3155803 RepID=UPI0034172B91